MRSIRARRRRAGLGATAAALVGLLLPTLGPGAASASAAAPPGRGSVSVTVADLTPLTPARSNGPRPLTVRLTLHNNTAQELTNVTVTAARGDPIGSAARLQSVFARPSAADANPLPIPTATGKPVTANLAPGADQDVVFRTAAGIAQGAPLCECADAVYPLLFTASYRDPTVGPVTLGGTQTYVPVFGLTQPRKVQVSWVWPILDRPHRLIANARDNVFIDDDLTSELGTGGRLDRLLQVVENVSARVPMTLVLDPDLLDEIQVMSTGSYTVRTPGIPGVTAGQGSAVAEQWLDRLRAVLLQHPKVEVDLTPLADPDVESLSQHGLDWGQTPTPQAEQRIATALGGVPTQDNIAWPVDGTLDRPTLTSLIRAGTQTVILRDSSLHGRSGATDIGLSPLLVGGFSALAAVTDAPIESAARAALQVDGAGTSALPKLVASVAVHAVQAPSADHYVVITPPRYLDPNVAVATRAILTTADSLWSAPLPLAAASRTIIPADRGTLHAGRRSSGLPTAVISAARTIRDRLPDLQSLFDIQTKAGVQTQTSTALLGPLPLAVQRTESSSWRYDPGGAATLARYLQARVQHWIRGVHLVRPATGTYTLTSTQAPLPITVDNGLGRPVSVVLEVHTQDGLPGLTTGPPRTLVVGAHSTVQVKLTVHLDRTGRLPVQVSLRTPSGLPLGTPVPPLTIHSTAIGTIGTVITVVAAVVLALALLLRVARRLRGRRRDTPREPAAPPTPVGIS